MAISVTFREPLTLECGIGVGLTALNRTVQITNIIVLRRTAGERGRMREDLVEIGLNDERVPAIIAAQAGKVAAMRGNALFGVIVLGTFEKKSPVAGRFPDGITLDVRDAFWCRSQWREIVAALVAANAREIAA